MNILDIKTKLIYIAEISDNDGDMSLVDYIKVDKLIDEIVNHYENKLETRELEVREEIWKDLKYHFEFLKDNK